MPLISPFHLFLDICHSSFFRFDLLKQIVLLEGKFLAFLILLIDLALQLINLHVFLLFFALDGSLFQSQSCTSCFDLIIGLILWLLTGCS